MATNVLEMPQPVKPERKKRAVRRGARGMGSVWLPTYTLADGTKRKARFYWIRYRDKEGTPHSECSNCETKEGARDLLKNRLGKISNGEFSDFLRFQDVTLSQVLGLLKAKYVTKGQRSLDKLERTIGLLEEHFGKDFPVAALTVDKIEAYRAARKLEKSKPTEFTIARELAALKAALRRGYRDDLVRKVPHIEMPDESERWKDGEFSEEQYTNLQAALPAHIKALTQFLYYTGMRIQEPIGLRWQEVDVERGELRISGRRTKNKQQKVLYLGGPALEVIRSQHESRNGEFVFHLDGQPLNYTMTLRAFQAVCADLGIGFKDVDGNARRAGFHDFRRTFARMADRKGIPFRTIKEIAGWKSDAMLLRYLGKSNQRDQREAFEKLA